jgi:hypothetical protein
MNEICTTFGFTYHYQAVIRYRTKVIDANIFYTAIHYGMQLILEFDSCLIEKLQDAPHYTLTHLQYSIEQPLYYEYFKSKNGFSCLQELVMKRPMEPHVRALACCFTKYSHELALNPLLVQKVSFY